MVQLLKVVHDTSVVRTILLSPTPESHWLYPYWDRRVIVPIVNPRTMGELRYHLRDHSGKIRIQDQKEFEQRKLIPYNRFLHQLPYQTFPNAPECRDPDDQQFLDLAYYSGSHCLLTEDQALLDLTDQVPFAILPAELFNQILPELFPDL